MNLKIVILITIGLFLGACKKDTTSPTLTTNTTGANTGNNNSNNTGTGGTGTNTNNGNNTNPNQIHTIILSKKYGQSAARVNQSVYYSAKAYNHNGGEIITDFSWTVVDTNIALVDTMGVAEGLSLGSTFIYVSARGVLSNRIELFVVNDCVVPFSPPSIADPSILGVPSSIQLNIGDSYELEDYIESKRTWVPMSAFKCSEDETIADLSVNANSGKTIITGSSSGTTIVTLSFHSLRKYIVVEVLP